MVILIGVSAVPEYTSSLIAAKNPMKLGIILKLMVSCSRVAIVQMIITPISLLWFPFTLTSEWFCIEGRENRQ